MAVEESDNITKNIVHEIIRECTKLKLDIEENFCTYYVKLLTLDPVWKISPEKKINRDFIQILVSFIIEKLKQTDNISLKTLKLQQLFLLHFLKRDIIISNKRLVLLNCVEPLLENILHFNIDEYNKTRFFKRISIYISSVALLGNPKNITVLRETIYALKSIFNDEEMEYFSNCKPEERFPYLNMLVKVVMGIRLYNHFSGRFCTDMPDLPKLLSSTIINMRTQISSTLESVADNVNITTTAIESLFSLEFDNEDEVDLCYMKLKLPENITEEDLYNTYDTLILYLQQQVYLEKLQDEVNTIDISLAQWIHNLQELLHTLNSTIKYQIAISTSIVFPLFADVADTWIKLQNLSLVMCEYIVLLEKLKSVAVNVVTVSKLYKMIGKNPVINSLHRIQRSENLKIDKSNLGSCELIEDPDLISVDYLELSGFCIWTFIQTQGALIPGNANMGVIKWNERFYIFAHPEGAKIFATHPESFIRRCLEMVRKKPELINLLQLYYQIYEVRDIETLYRKSIQIPTKNEKIIQTDTHPIPAHIDKTYIWNKWKLLRNATILANVVEYKTHSSQTRATHFKNPVCTQTSLLRNKYCQTKTDNYSTTPTPSAFIFGLRGRHDNVQHMISLNSQTEENNCNYKSSSIKSYHLNYQARNQKEDTVSNITTKEEKSPKTSQKNSCSCEDK